MPTLAQELRPLWLPGIHKITGRASRGLLGLVAGQGYQVYSPASANRAELHFANWSDVAEAFAADVTGMSTAAIETAEGVGLSTALPRSTAWLLVRSYYGGFFAAHALARMLGLSHLQIDDTAALAVDEVTALFGMRGKQGLATGLFRCTTDAAKGLVTLERLPAGSSHAVFWADFAGLLREASTRALGAQNATPASLVAGARFIEIETSLRDGGSAPKGNWLTRVRNRINYQHADGTWFPYDGRADYYGRLLEMFEKWQHGADEYSLWPVGSRDLQRFVETCGMLIALCREVCIDMAERCPSGRSFHHYASLRLLNHLGY